jgi:hypothetical protein
MMIEKGSSQEGEARRHIRRMESMLKVWNDEADRLRRVARTDGGGQLGLREAERLLGQLDAALDLTDRLVLDIERGDELIMDLLRLNVTLSALSASVSHSTERLTDLAAQQREIAGPAILVDAAKARSARV